MKKSPLINIKAQSHHHALFLIQALYIHFDIQFTFDRSP